MLKNTPQAKRHGDIEKDGLSISPASEFTLLHFTSPCSTTLFYWTAGCLFKLPSLFLTNFWLLQEFEHPSCRDKTQQIGVVERKETLSVFCGGIAGCRGRHVLEYTTGNIESLARANLYGERGMSCEDVIGPLEISFTFFFYSFLYLSYI